MSLKMFGVSTEMRSRVLSGAFILGAAALTIWINNWLLYAVGVALALLIFYELSRMASLSGRFHYLFVGAAAALLGGQMVAIALVDDEFALMARLVALAAAGLIGAAGAFYLDLRAAKLTAILWLGAVYVSIGMTHFADIATLGTAWAWLLLLFAGVFASDTAAFMVGKHFGKHKLAPKISPNKTVEGLLAALIITPLVAMGLLAFLPLDLAWYFGAPIGVAHAVVSVFGDLIESVLKRSAGVKDSGDLIPGHGGFFDRFDSLAPSAILIFWLGFALG